MATKLLAHPFSSYCQKVLTALYENDTPFEFRLVQFHDEEAVAELAALWPLKRFPVLVDDGRTIVESSVIIEHLDLYHPGRTRFLPADPKAALDVRFMDRVFDNYVMTPVQRVVFDAMRPEGQHDPAGVEDARRLLDTAYAWLEGTLAGRTWAAGEVFTLADCAAAPSLFYADWVHRIGDDFPNLRAYRGRLLERPSYARALDEARPYRHLFPLGDPGRD